MKSGLKKAAIILGRFVSIKAVQSPAVLLAMNRERPELTVILIFHQQKLVKIHPQTTHIPIRNLNIVSAAAPRASAATMATNIRAPMVKKHADWMAGHTNARMAAGAATHVQKDAIKRLANASIQTAPREI